MRNKDKSGIFMMATYKSVMSYQAMRDMVDVLLENFNVFEVNKESIITEVIFKSKDKKLSFAEIHEIVKNYETK